VIVKKLYLKDFRSYTDADFGFSGGVNLILGENGVGKTNLLEALYLLSGRRSWRSGKSADLIRWESGGAYVYATVENERREYEVKINMPALGRGSVFINGVKAQKKAEMSGITKCVVFSPDDLEIIKGGSSQRRELLDDVLCQQSSKYADALSRYEKFLRFKQKVLSGGGDTRLLPDFNAALAQSGAYLVKKRAEMCQSLSKTADIFHKSISGDKEELTAIYKTVSVIEDTSAEVGEIEKQLFSRFTQLQAREIAAEGVLSGVHRDDLEVFINGRSAKSFASQGQARTAAIALKFAQRELLSEDGDLPLLLLDDVLSELDEKRQSFILSHTGKGQTFITCCQRPNIDGNVNVVEI